MNTLNKKSDAEGLNLGPVTLFTRSKFDENFGTRFDESRIRKLLEFLGVKDVHFVTFGDGENIWAPNSRGRLVRAAGC